MVVRPFPDGAVAERAQIRRQIRDRRRILTSSVRRSAARRMARTAAASAVFRTSRRIGLYLPNDSEMDPLPLLRRAWSRHKRCYLPLLDPLGSNRLWFVPYRAGDRLKPNRYGIPEPVRPARARIRARQLDLVLAPLVAFDALGHRLGMGGGYYDRSLRFRRRRRHWRRPRFYGLAYELQKVSRLPAAAWDIDLDGCFTEARPYIFPQQPAHAGSRP